MARKQIKQQSINIVPEEAQKLKLLERFKKLPIINKIKEQKPCLRIKRKYANDNLTKYK